MLLVEALLLSTRFRLSDNFKKELLVTGHLKNKAYSQATN
jgi:hypothetical protein